MMLEPILQGLREVEGVQGALVIDHAAAIVGYRAHAIYDLGVLQQVARSVVNSIDSVQLVQDDWDMLTAHFGDGKLLLRSLRTSGTRPRRFVLTVIADSTLNVAFLGVALRVAAGKLITELESAPSTIPQGSSPVPVTDRDGSIAGKGPRDSMAPGSSLGVTPNSSGRIPTFDSPSGAPSGSRAELARSGLSWSGVGSGSGIGGSDVGVTDSASSTFLSACTKALAASVGPMAKVFVKEAVRKVCGERPFSRADGPALLAHLATTIEDTDDRAMFQRATRSL